MKKILLYFTLGINFAYADIIKLSCDLTYDESGKKTKIYEIVTIEQIADVIFIDGAGSYLLSVSSKSPTPEYTIIDKSLKNKWDITSTKKTLKDGKEISVTANYNIDRNTGLFFYQHFITNENKNYADIVKANGSCKKIDITKNKF